MGQKIKKLKKIRLHREGTDQLVYGMIAIVAIAAILWSTIDNKIPFWIFVVVFGTVYGIVLNFYRCPIRYLNIEDTDNLVVAPADGKIVVIEEVDNGLHPSRSKELIKALEEIGRERNIDVLCTTHNPYLIDSLGTDMIPCITYVKRNEHTGSSELNTLDENENLVNMMASGSIGLSMVKGRI